jgi:hypothetical protein
MIKLSPDVRVVLARAVAFGLIYMAGLTSIQCACAVASSTRGGPASNLARARPKHIGALTDFPQDKVAVVVRLEVCQMAQGLRQMT